MIEKGQIIGSRYEIIEKVGSGGMAIVYKAKCNLLNRFVAIKILKPEFNEDGDFVKKFRREAQSAASLSHPNIVSIYDVGVENNIHYIVMEYIKGKTLKELIEQNGRISNDWSIQYSLQISSALEHAHHNHIIHRDIKSHNIIVKEDGTIKVTDFGIARVATSSTMTNTGSVLGSVHYLSPEQAKGGFTDERSDIYSLGVVLYEMVTGILPFDADTAVSVALKQLQDMPIAPKEVNSLVSTSLNSIIMKCLEKPAEMRYQSATELISDLRSALISPNRTFRTPTQSVSQETRKFDYPKIEQKPEAEVEDKEDDDEEGSQLIRKIKGIFFKNEDEMDEEQEKRVSKSMKKKKSILPFIIIALIAILMVVGIKFAIELFSVAEEVVPEITGMEEQEAQDDLKELGFTMTVTERVLDEKVPKGKIISQDPQSGIKNKVTNPIKVIVSEGAKNIIMPKLVNQLKDDALIAISEAGLQEGTITPEYSTLPKDMITWQSIDAGDEVEEGTKVDLKISSGSEKLFMPDYKGRSLSDVKADIKENDLIMSEPTYVYHDTYAKDIVVDQNITPSSEVVRKSVVQLVVSKGPDPSGTVPPVTPEEKPVKKTITFNLPEGVSDVLITIIQTEKNNPNNSNKIYNQKKSSADSPISVTASGKGTYIFTFYIDTSLIETREEEF